MQSAPEHTVHAAVFFSYAVEEVGKAILLRDSLGVGRAQVVVNGFYDHVAKLKKATEYLGKEHLILLPSWVDNTSGWIQTDPAWVQGDVITDFEVRLLGLYVDWDDRTGAWRPILPVDAERLRDNISYLESRMTQW